jgi:hypothetical protein
MLQIFSTSRDLASATNYALIARGKASKATKVYRQHKKQDFDTAICAMLDKKPKKANKQARQKAAAKFQQLKNKK